MKFYKRLGAVCALLCVLTALTACSFSAPSRTAALSADGTVKEAVFEDAMKNSKMLTFTGQSGGSSYFWFFDGGSISSVSDQNLKIDFQDADKELDGVVKSSEILKLHFHEANVIQAKTTLEVHLDRLWNAQQARIYQKAAGSVALLQEVPLNNAEKTSFTFPVPAADGDLYVVAKDASFQELPSRLIVKSAAQQNSPGVQSDPSGGSTPGGAADTSPSGSGKSIAGSFSSAPQNSSAGPASSVAPPSSGKAVEKWDGSPADGVSSGTLRSGKDQYLTDPTPKGKPKPKEPQNAKVDQSKAYYCTLSIDCKTILDNLPDLKEEKKSVLPQDGVILKSQKVVFYEGESVFDVLLRETKKRGIQMEYEATPMYNSNYIEGIHNLYEFDCGDLSGWMYKVNGWFPNYGCSRYQLKDGDVIQWRYTCDCGKDVGCDWDVSQK
jgi:hypothetical protein